MKHQFGLRMFNAQTGLPMQKLFLYETDNEQLTIDDFIAINSKDERYQLIVHFYIGYMSREDALEQYDKYLSR